MQNNPNSKFVIAIVGYMEKENYKIPHLAYAAGQRHIVFSVTGTGFSPLWFDTKEEALAMIKRMKIPANVKIGTLAIPGPAATDDDIRDYTGGR